jgi:hypothetical protein
MFFSLFFLVLLQLAKPNSGFFSHSTPTAGTGGLLHCVSAQLKMHLLKSRFLGAIRMLPTFPNAL